MCGIVGYIGTKPIDESELKILLLKAMPRGRRATGIATRKLIQKDSVSAEEFIKKRLPTDKLVLGHTRLPTIGSNTPRNAHPFTYRNIVGVHNGGIGNYRTFKSEAKEEGLDIQVDSEVIWFLLSKYGLEETHKKLKGSYALAWFEKKKNHLNLFRYTNPIWIGRKHNCLYFGSLRDYLVYIGCDDITFLDEETHYEINLKGEIVNETPIKKITLRREKKKEEGGTNKREDMSRTLKKYYEPNTAPSHAKFIYAENGMGYWYWFPTKTNPDKPFLLKVEKVNHQVHYLSGLDEFDLADETETTRLATSMPEVYNLSEIQNKTNNE